MTALAAPRPIDGPAGRPAIIAVVQRLLRGRAEDASWVRPAFIGVIALAAILYVWNLTVSGYANTYYAMAAQAASQSWSAWFFGSLDAANFITVDKPPLATMLLGLSVRLLGLNSWSILLPQALLGVATVALLFALVRRALGPAAAVIAALAAALTPAAVLMFRYDNPDALLTFLFMASAGAIQRALIDGRTRWLLLAALFVGLAFNTKFLQAYLVVPALGLAYFVAGPPRLRKRVGQLAVFGVASIAASAWWVAVMEWLPASARPYVGGSDTNSALELLLGYDGLGRIFGLSGGPGGGAGGFGGEPGIFRLFNAEFGGQVSWLLPLAAAGLVLGLWARRHAPRTDLARSAYLLWGTWLAVHAIVFSLMSGIVHPYYTVAMAPAISALAGGGLVELWRLRGRFAWGGLLFGAAVLGTAAWGVALLWRTPEFVPGLGATAMALAVVAAVALAVPALRRSPRVSLSFGAVAMVALLVGPAAYAADTIGTAYSGGDPSAGPSVPGARVGPGGPGLDGGDAPGPPGQGPTGFPVPPPGTTGGANRTGGRPAAPGAAGSPGAAGAPGATAGIGDGGERVNVDQALLDYLIANRAGATWLVAANGSGEAAGLQLASGIPVMAMGGFSGGDPAPTAQQLASLVDSGQLRFVLLGGRGAPGRGGPGFGGAGGGSGTSVNSWVMADCTLVDSAGNGSLYDCAPAA